MNGVEVDSVGLYNTNSADTNYDDADELEGQVSNQHQSLARYPLLPYSKHLTAKNAQEFGGRVVDDDSVIVDSSASSSASATLNNQIRSRFARQQQQGEVTATDEQQVTSEPRGFFYSFDYPVSYIRSHAARDLSYEEQQPTNIVEHFVSKKTSEHEKEEENQTDVDVATASAKKIEVTAATTKSKRNSNNAAELNPAHEIYNREEETAQQQSRKVNRSVNRGRGSIKFKQTIN